MKNPKILKLCVCLIVILSSLILWGCGEPENENPAVKSVDIRISIDFPDKAKLPDLNTLPFRVEENTSALQAVELYGNVNNISILIDTTYSTLEGIDGVINGVTLKAGQWQCKINGKNKTKLMNDVILKDGDHLELVYTKAKEPQ